MGRGEWLEAVDREVSKCGEVAGGGAVLGRARVMSRGGGVSREGECSAATVGKVSVGK